MRKTIIAAMLAALCAPAFATESRNSALQAESWRILDDTNVKLFPADVVNFNKAVYGELTGPASTTDDYAGVHVPFGPGVLAIYGGDIPMTSGASALFGNLGTATPNFPEVPSAIVRNTAVATAGIPDGRFNAVWGMTLQSGLSLALGAEWFSQVKEDDKDINMSGTEYSHSDSSSMLGIRGGISLPAGPFQPLTFGLRFGLPTFSSVTGTTWAGGEKAMYTYESTGGTAIDFNVRGRVKELVAPGSESFFYLAYSTGTINGEGTTTKLQDSNKKDIKDTEKITKDEITVGMSTNHKVGDASLAIWALAFKYGTAGHEVENSIGESFDGYLRTTKTSVLSNTIAVPVTLGFEMKIFNWLAGRVSSTSSIINRTTTTATVKADTTSPVVIIPDMKNKAVRVTDTSSQNVALGITLYAGEKLEIDGVISQTLLFNGPYFIGGPVAGTGPGLFTQVSTTFRF